MLAPCSPGASPTITSRPDASPKDETLVRGFGADVVLPRGEALVAAIRSEAPEGVDAVFDPALLRRDVLPAIRVSVELRSAMPTL